MNSLVASAPFLFTEDWAVELNDALATFGTPLLLAFTMMNLLTNEYDEYSDDVEDSDKIHSSVSKWPTFPMKFSV